MKTIILGVGNLILGDDGIGIHVIHHLKKHIENKDIVLDEAMTGGMNLLDKIIGYDKAILIDAVNIKEVAVGEVKRFLIQDFTSVHSCNPHDVSLIEAITLAETLGDKHIPKKIIVIGIVLHEMPLEFTETLSPKVAAAIPKAVEAVISELNET
ncbi:MAG: hypothetical protein DRN27_02795 [Thermoplasmata archaeon]|nr:MAG: hypothetical protein DRN27_02795 [Thermoplasmata archaeon]